MSHAPTFELQLMAAALNSGNIVCIPSRASSEAKINNIFENFVEHSHYRTPRLSLR